MRPETPDLGYLWDMRSAALLVRSFVTKITYEQYAGDPLVRSAVERQVEIIGEAARRVSDEFRAAHPEIAWSGIVAQRHVLAHEYGDIDDQLIWRVATVRIPELIALLDPLFEST
jgi:uncharacterized protein with HEPN domain